jgi:hypothetical protein
VLNLSARSQFGNAILSAFGLEDERNLVSRSEYRTTWSGVVPSSQDYAVKVVSLAGNELRYTFSASLSARSGGPINIAPPAEPPPAARAIARPDPIVLQGAAVLPERPISSLSSEALQFLEGRKDDWGVAVIVPDEQAVYVANPDQQMETASVVKVFVMLTVLTRRSRSSGSWTRTSSSSSGP